MNNMILEYKGVFYNEHKERKYYEGGAHFKYKDLFSKLLSLQKEIYPPIIENINHIKNNSNENLLLNNKNLKIKKIFTTIKKGKIENNYLKRNFSQIDINQNQNCYINNNINNYNKLVGLHLKLFNIKERTNENFYNFYQNKRNINRSMINEKIKCPKKLNIKLIKNNIFNYYLNNNLNELGNKNNVNNLIFPRNYSVKNKNSQNLFNSKNNDLSKIIIKNNSIDENKKSRNNILKERKLNTLFYIRNKSLGEKSPKLFVKKKLFS